MIKLEGKDIALDRFPDGTLLIKPEIEFGKLDKSKGVSLIWHFESNEEVVALMFITRHLQNHGIKLVNLIMPYIPNARQDRVKTDKDVFTLKYFAELINSLNFNSVTVLDPHSYVSEALINNIIVENPKKYIDRVISELKNSEAAERPLMAFYPDEGAMKRYSGLLSMQYAFGIKRRNWETGKLEGLDIAGAAELIPTCDIIIIDDISSRGGTFYHSAVKLKELGANRIYLYITHCEKTILDGEVFKCGLIDKVFTTDSIFGAKAQAYAKSMGVGDKIEVIKYEKD